MNVGQQKHSRFLVVDYEADEISVVWRSVAFPGKFYSIALGIVGLEFYYMTFTLGKRTQKRFILKIFDLAVFTGRCLKQLQLQSC